MTRDSWLSVLDVEGKLPGEPPATEEVSGEQPALRLTSNVPYSGCGEGELHLRVFGIL